MDYKLETIKKHVDNRGQLVVFLKNSGLKKSNKEFGQIYFVTFDKEGIVRGNHYHKKWREWFGIVSGKLKVVLKDVKTNEIVELIIDSDSKVYSRLEIGPGIIHSFKSISSYAALLNYADSEWSDDDTFPLELMG